MAAKGTKVADVFIAIGGDLSEYNKSLGDAAKGAKGVASEIKAALSGKEVGRAGIGGFIEDLKLGGRLTTALRGNITGMAGDLRQVTVSGLSAGLNSLERIGQRVFGTIKGLASNALKGFAQGIGIGAFLSLESAFSRLTHVIPDLISKGRDYANEIDQIIDVTGAGSRESSILASTLNFLGQDVSTVFIRLGQLSKSVVTHETELNRLGVVTRNASGDLLNQVQILDSIRTAFSGLTNATDRTRLEILLFGGRGGLGQLVDYLQLTDEQMAALTDQFDKQGLIISDSTRMLGEETQRSFKNVDNSITGLATTLFETVGPQLVAFFDGLANYISANAQQIADFIASIVNTIIGLVQGLTGLDLNFNSLTTSVENMTAAVSDSSVRLVGIEGNIDKLKKQLKNAGGEATNFNDGIERQVKLLEEESKAIDAQIKHLNDLGATQDRIFRRGLDNLEKQLDAENDLLDAEDKRLDRAQRDEDLARGIESADRAHTKAIKDQRDAVIDLANAQARYNQDLADPDLDPVERAKALAKDTLAIADAADRVRDANVGIADSIVGIGDANKAVSEEGRRRREEDRRAQLAALRDYVEAVAKIADDPNKKAAGTTLGKREDVLRQQQDLARAKGNAQEVADLQIKIDAVVAAEKKVKADQARADEIDDLNARKARLQEEIAAVRASKTTQTAINKAEIGKQIADLEKQAAAERKRIAEKKAEDAETSKRLHLYGEDVKTTYATKVNPAFEGARLAGIKFADDVKGAINGLMDLLLGKESRPTGGKQGPAGPRTGGLFGAIGSIAGAFTSIAPAIAGFWSALTQFDAKAVGFAIAVFGATRGILPLVLTGLSIATVGLITDTAGNAGVTADPSGQGGPGKGSRVPNSSSPTLIAQANIKAAVARNDPTHFNPDTGETDYALIQRLRGEIKSGEFTRRGYAAGGLVTHPGFIAERGPEYVLSPDMLTAIGRLDRLGTPAFAGASEGIVVENHNHLTLPWDNRAVDFISRSLAYRRRS